MFGHARCLLFPRPALNMRLISTTQSNCINRKWREERGLPQNPNACGVLTDGPDYTFLDGRPTPYGIKQRQRLELQKSIAEKVIQLSGEVDFAVERHKQLQIDEENRKKQIINNKLKEKGPALLKKR